MFDEARIEETVRGDLVESLYKQNAMTLIMAVLLSAYLWFALQDVTSPTVITAWLVATNLITLGRFVLAWAYRRAAEQIANLDRDINPIAQAGELRRRLSREGALQAALAAEENAFDLVDVLRARREVQQHFRGRRHLLVGLVEKDFADLVADARTPGFGRLQHLIAQAAQLFREHPHLRTLAAAVESFEGDELAAVGRHRAMIATVRSV